MPTSEWKAATSSGIDVIGTRRAITAPMPPPMAMPPITSTQATGLGRRMRAERGEHGDRHADHAEQVALPAGLRARQPAQRQDEQDAGDEIEQRGEIRRSLRVSLLFLLVHRQHALGDQEAAEDVHRGEDQRDEAERARPERAIVIGDQRDADREQRADHDHRGDRVGHRHQRRVQRRRHRPDHVVADEDRQHEDREPEHEGIDGVGGLRPWRWSCCAVGDRASDAALSQRSGRLRLEIRMHDRAVARQQRRLDDFVVPVDRELLLFLVDQRLEEGRAGSWRRAPRRRPRAGPAR